MLHLFPCLTTFNIVGYLNERELNNWCGVSSICNLLHIELHLIFSIVCAFCRAMLIKSDMHHTWLCIIPCLCDDCLLCCLFLSGLLLSLASVSFRSCEDSFDYVCLSSSWTRSSSLRDLRQDDHYPRYHFYLCLLVASFYRYAALPIFCSSSLPNCHEPLTFVTLPSKPLLGYVTSFAQPLL